MNKLQSLDLNKTPITISHKNKKHNSSKTGGLCSLFFLLIMLVITFYKMNELLITKNAKLTSYQITESQKLDLYDANIFICIRDFSDPDNWEKFVGFKSSINMELMLPLSQLIKEEFKDYQDSQCHVILVSIHTLHNIFVYLKICMYRSMAVMTDSDKNVNQRLHKNYKNI